MIRLVVNARSSAMLRGGHPWVYRDELTSVPEELPEGEEADVVDERGRFLGRGFTSPRSRIVCRIATRKREPLDREFLKKRIEAAHEFRRSINLPSARTNAYRLVYADSDRLPGIMIDRYGDYFVLQTPTVGTDRRKDAIAGVLVDLFRPAGICERNDMKTREQEGLPLVRSWLSGTPADSIEIKESGVSFRVDPIGAMKTGHFCDQRENRRLLEGVSRARTVLDLFCYTGGFSLAAARAGASRVLSVDGSAEAIAAARANAEANGVADRVEQRAADAFDVLREFEAQGRTFDLVVVDPPAFAKSKAHLENALRAYRDVNTRALRLLPAGGHLLTCSCSYHVGRSDFRRMLQQAAGEAGRFVRLVAEGGQGPDHPILLNIPETDYLKAALVQVVARI